MLITGVLVLGALMMRNLNVIAPLIAGFFLISYAVVNVVMLVESSLGLVSFRPTLRLPRWIPLLGATGCLFAMFIVNPVFSLVAWVLVFGLYFWIMQRRLSNISGDVRSGVFVAFAEWAASKVTALGINTSRAWKPSFLVPVVDGAELRGEFRLLVDMCRPSGSVKMLGIADKQSIAGLGPRVKSLSESFLKAGVFSTWSAVDSGGFVTGTIAGLQALQSAFFRPNILAVGFPESPEGYDDYESILRESQRLGVASALFGMHPRAGLGRKSVLNVWLRPPPGPADVASVLAKGNMNLGVLLGYRLARAWNAQMNMIAVVQALEDIPAAERYLEDLRELSRMPASTQTHVLVGALDDVVGIAPQSDIDIMGMPKSFDMGFVVRMIESTRSSCIFTVDSENVNALT